MFVKRMTIEPFPLVKEKPAGGYKEHRFSFPVYVNFKLRYVLFVFPYFFLTDDSYTSFYMFPLEATNRHEMTVT